MRGPGQPSSNSLLPHSLWSREGLTRYLLCCCQGKSGGLRDKPGARPDAYHTCYSLAGLNAAQNYYYYPANTEQGAAPLSAGFNWRVDASQVEDIPFDEGDRVRLVHPVYVLPWGAAERTRGVFEHKGVF